jgi:broad specificity phosphatase PhoE
MTTQTTNPEMPGATELLLVRHGQSEANAGTSTEPDCALSDLGRQQARALARRLGALDLSGFVALTSPYRRAVQTAEEVALATGLSFAVDEALREWGPTATVGGRTYPQEPVADTVHRLERFLRERAGQRLVIVSHGAPIALLTQLAWGETPTTAGQFWTGVSNCCSRWVKTTCAP